MHRRDTWTRGLGAGLTGALAVLAWFLVIDLIAGQPLLTSGALGSALFLGARGPGEVEVGLASVGGYMALHIVVFGALGLGASAAVSRARRRPRVLLAAVLVVAVVATFLLSLLAVMAQLLLGDLAWWSVAAGGALGGVGIGAYLWSTDRDLERAMEKDPFRRDQ